MPATNRKNTPRLRDGVMKRGTTWSYVIRVKDPESGISKPRWVGGFATEEDAKAARDEARVKARHGEYIDRNRITVAAYLDDWIDAHAMEIKPRTLADYRACIRLYAAPRIGHLPIQAIRPSTITKLYRDLLTSGGRDGQPLAVATVTHLHAVLRKAFHDAVVVDELIGSNPVERAKRPRTRPRSPAPSGPSSSFGRSWPRRSNTGCSRSSTSPRTPGRGAASCSTCGGKTLTSTARRSPSPARRP
jgi:hypothetical protein